MSLKPISLRTEYRRDPAGLDTLVPRMSWALESGEYGQTQTAYRIVVSTSREALYRGIGDLWDSGKVLSDESIHIPYSGTPLKSRQTCYWKVRVWDRQDIVSDWSLTGSWTMGLLDRREWLADWISAPTPEMTDLFASPYLRKQFAVNKALKRATVYTSALGLYLLYLNGDRVSDDLFTPGWTDYHARVQYQTYDLTNKIHEGINVIGAILGAGWYAGQVGMIGHNLYGAYPYLIAQLHLEYIDGSIETVLSDGSWKASTGPIRFSDIIRGEMYDKRLEHLDWAKVGFCDDSWSQAIVTSPECGELVGQLDPPVRCVEDRMPVSVRKSSTNTYIFDMGQNMVGWAKITTRGVSGQKISLSYSEMLNPDGTLYTENLRMAKQTDTVILCDDQEMSYEPHFTFHGFRYVEVCGLSLSPDLFTIVGKVVHSMTESTGEIRTSDAYINKLQSNIVWGQKSNFLSVPTDCPQRDERLGWTGDAQIFVRTASFNAQVASFFTKYMNNVRDAQTPEGAFPDVAPDAGWRDFKIRTQRLSWNAPDNAGWGDAGVIIPWTIYQVYGDKRILETNYSSMVHWIEYLKENSNQLIRPDYSNYGDWLSIGADTPKDVLATAYFAYSVNLLSKIAAVIGRMEDRGRYSTLFREICSRFQEVFVDDGGRIKGETQTCYVVALRMGLLTEEQEKQAIQHLVDDIQSRDNHLSTGFLGVGYLLPVLTDFGRLDVAYSLLTQDSFPSWLYSIKHGATTIWERWDGWTDHNGFQTPSMNSFNHYSLGSVGEWMYRTILGIDATEQGIGFKHILVHPRPGGGITWAEGHFQSMYGRISINWVIEGREFTITVTVPPNTSANVIVPGKNVQIDTSLQKHVHEVATSSEIGAQLYVGSGTYTFKSTL